MSPAARRLAPLGLALLLVAAPAAAAHLSFSVGDDGLEFDGDEVVINADDEREARVSPAGVLEVDGRRLALTDRDRQLLARYNRTLQQVKERAIDIGFESVGLAASAIGEAILAVATGNEGRAERRVEARAEDIKEEARALCAEVRVAERLQDAVAERVPAFRPFAVIDIDAGDCQVDD